MPRYTIKYLFQNEIVASSFCTRFQLFAAPVIHLLWIDLANQYVYIIPRIKKNVEVMYVLKHFIFFIAEPQFTTDSVKQVMFFNFKKLKEVFILV